MARVPGVMSGTGSGRPLRLLMTISDLSGGGAEREFSILAHHLPRDELDIHVALWRTPSAYPAPSDLPVRVLDKTRPWHFPRTISRLRRLIDEIRPDCVLSMLSYPSLLTGEAVVRARKRSAWACRLMNPPERELTAWKGVWARRILPRADRVVACSKGVESALARHLNLDPHRLQTLPNPVDVDRVARLAAEPLPLERPPETFVVVHAGRLHPQKHQALLLTAFSRLRVPRAELWMLGEGSEKKRLQALASRLGIAPRVRWLGFRDNPFPFFRAADCFALSSRWEGFPNVLIEAMACGTPVISTRCPYGPDELIEDGVRGLL
ncbi:MAG: glycosyltransferase, partial [bacterium]|nr:glycosyltransferase [bacterium]